MNASYNLRLMFEWGGGCIWAGDEESREKFGVGPIEEKLGLSRELESELNRMTEWHDKSLNWEYPPDPGPWSAKEFEEFHSAATKLKEKLEKELGPMFSIQYIVL